MPILGVGSLLAGVASPSATNASALAIPPCGNPAAATAEWRLPAAIPAQDPAPASVPAVSATAAVVIDADTGRVLLDEHAHDRLPPASTTKIMTAILAIEHGNLDRTVVSDIDATTLIGSSVMGLRPGIPITMQDLLYGLMLPSGNDAAIEIAKTLDGSEPAFVDEMNGKAAQIGLQDTQFRNPHGLDTPGHYSSAFDLAMLARYAMRNPQFESLVATTDHQLSPPWDYDLHNGNSMLTKYAGADGVKIGWTEEAGWTLVASATRDGHRLIATVLNSQDRDADASALLDWAFGSYRWVGLDAQAGQALHLAQRLGVGDALVKSLANCS